MPVVPFVPPHSPFPIRPEIADDGISRVFNPRSGAPLVITAPHAFEDGLEELGLLDPSGQIIPGIDLHRIKDENLEPLVYAMALHGFPIVTSKFTRMFFDAACLPSFALSRKTRDGVEIPGFHGPQSGALMHKARQCYNAFIKTLWRQIYQNEAGPGRRHVLSLDTFTPQSLPGDLCDRRDMLICLIANGTNMDRAESMKKALQHRLSSVLGGVISRIRPGHEVNGDNLVIINRPYGHQVLDRQLVLPEGGLTADIRSDALADNENVNVFAEVLAQTFRDIFPERLEAAPVKPTRPLISPDTSFWGPDAALDI